MNEPHPSGTEAAVRSDPQAIDRILHAYRESQLLMTSVRLGLFAGLDPGGRPVSLEHLARAARIAPPAAGVLCAGLVGLGLLEERDGGYLPSTLAAAHLAPGAQYPLGEWVASEQTKYVGFGGLVEALRADPPPSDPAAAPRRNGGLPAAQQPPLAEVARARGPETALALGRLLPDAAGRAGRILDAGGGHGMDAIGVLLELPSWRAVVADRPGPLALARANAGRHGVAERLTTCAVDLECDDLVAATGGGFDVGFLFMVLGGKPEPEALTVLSQLLAALRPGGWLLVRGNWIDPLRAATSALKHMLRPGGRPTLSQDRLLELLGVAGFADAQVLAGEGVTPNAILVARRPPVGSANAVLDGRSEPR